MSPDSRRYWRNRRTARRWRYRLAPNPATTPEKAPPRWTTRLRRVFWHWVPWAIVAAACLATQNWAASFAAGVMAWISFVTMPLEHSPQRGLDHEFSIADPEFLPTVAGATGHNPLPGNRLTLLNNGDEFYPAMLDAIRGADASITIEAYIYWGGQIGREFAAALAKRSRAGIAVKILLDAVGSVRVGEDVLKILEDGRCHVAWYNPLRWFTMGRLNHRTHRKSLIVDGRIGFTGGAGIADQWLGHAQNPDHWRDIQIRIEGPATRPLQTGFAQNWMQTTGELITGERYYPDLRPAGPIAAFTIMSSPEGGASSVRTMYYLSILCARKSIYIANSYFVPDEVATAALIDAKRRGVDVRVMVAGIHNDTWLARQNSVRLYGRLLRAGITILEYNRTMLHQKTMVIDGLWSTVGTTNFDNRSFAHNEENNVCVHNAAWAHQMQRVFLEDAAVCDTVTLESWQRRGLGRRIVEVMAGFFEDQV